MISAIFKFKYLFLFLLIQIVLLFTSESFSQTPSKYLTFNGNSDYINCGYNEVLRPSTKLTLSISFKTDIVNSWQSLIWCGNYYENNYALKITPDYKIRGLVWINGSHTIFSDSTIELNKWYQISMTYDSSLTENNFKLYINGNIQAQSNVQGSIGSDSEPFIIGVYPGLFNQYFKGGISNVQLWNRALSQAEIQEKMNKSLNPQNEQGLVAYWPMNEDEGNIIHDLSGNGNNGNIYGAEWFPNNTVHAIFHTNNVWIDSLYQGLAANEVDASLSTGENLSYTWSVGADTLATGINPIIKLPTGSQYLVLTLRNDSGAVSKDSSLISVYAARLLTYGPIYSAISELDDNTFFTSSADDRVYQFDSLGHVQWTFLTGGNIQSTVTVSDENNIFATSSDTRLYSFNYLGEPNWDIAMGGVVVSSPTFYKDNEILVGLTTGRLFAISYDGKIKWSFQTDGELAASPIISNNGKIFLGSKDKKIYAVTVNGDSLWSYLTADEIVASPAIGTDHSVVFGSKDGYLYKLDEDGNFLWKFKTEGGIYSAPVIGENGQIFIGSSDGYCYSISKSGDLIWKYNTHSSIKSTASISSDGSTIFVGNDAGNIFAFSSGGSLIWYLNIYTPISAPTLITKSNLLLVGTIYGSLYIMKTEASGLDKKASNINLEWPTYLGNNQRTGDQQTVVTGSKKDEQIINHFELMQNYPNPFNPSTMISFSLLKESNVNITIFNVLGQMIKEYNLNINSEGFHQFEWTASNVASGIYFYSIHANPTDGSNEFNAVRKMIFLK